MSGRSPKGERGFTLPEVLVAMAMMGTVLFALYAAFDASVRVFGAGRDRVEAVQNARLGLARMERELRAAYPLNKAGGNATLLASFGADHVTFGNDVRDDERRPNRRVLRPDGTWENKEKISYRASESGVALRNGLPLVASAENAGGMTFEYFDANGYPVTAGEESDVTLVRITLEVAAEGAPGEEPSKRTLTTSVALRNR